MKRTLLLLLFSYVLFSCNQKNKDANRLKVYLDIKGVITANGQVVTFEELDKKMKELKDKKGVVYYSRDNGTNDGPKESIQIMDIIVKYQLPVRFYTDNTFTNPVVYK